MREFNYTETKITRRKVQLEDYKGFVKVKDTREVETNGVKKEITNVFLTSKDKVENIEGLKPISKEIYVKGLYQNKAEALLLSKENYNKLLHAEMHVSDENVFENYKEGYSEEDYDLVLWNWGSYELLDLDLNHLPVAVHCSYMIEQGAITEKNYDLTSLVERLKEENTVIACSRVCGKRELGGPLQVSSIPYYNAREDEQQQVEFYIVPSKEIYNEMIKLDHYQRVPFLLEKMYGITKLVKTES